MSLFDGNTITEEYLISRGFSINFHLTLTPTIPDASKYYRLTKTNNKGMVECIYHLSEYSSYKPNSLEIYVKEGKVEDPAYLPYLFVVSKEEKIVKDTIELESILHKYEFI